TFSKETRAAKELEEIHERAHKDGIGQSIADVQAAINRVRARHEVWSVRRGPVIESDVSRNDNPWVDASVSPTQVVEARVALMRLRAATAVVEGLEGRMSKLEADQSGETLRGKRNARNDRRIRRTTKALNDARHDASQAKEAFDQLSARLGPDVM